MIPYAIIIIAILVLSLTNKSGRETMAIMFNLLAMGSLILMAWWVIDSDQILNILNEKSLSAAIYTVTAIIGSAAVIGYLKKIPTSAKKTTEGDENENEGYRKPLTRDFSDHEINEDKTQAINSYKKTLVFPAPLKLFSRTKNTDTENGMFAGDNQERMESPAIEDGAVGEEKGLEAYLDKILSRLEPKPETENNTGEETIGNHENFTRHTGKNKGGWDEIKFHTKGNSGYVSIGTKDKRKIIPGLITVLRFIKDNIGTVKGMGKYLVWALLAMIVFMIISMIIGSLR
jgi:hypothetical protein